MLLNEFLKAHRRCESEAATIAQMKSTIAAQQEQIKSLMGSLKEQAIQIQTVADQVALSRHWPPSGHESVRSLEFVCHSATNEKSQLPDKESTIMKEPTLFTKSLDLVRDSRTRSLWRPGVFSFRLSLASLPSRFHSPRGRLARMAV